MPCKVEEDVTDSTTEVSCQDANMQYMIRDEDLDESYNTMEPEALLVDIVNDIKHPDNGEKVEVVDEKPLVLQAYAGREYTALYPKGIVESRLYIADGRVYHLMVAATSKSFSNAYARKFLDSFHLVASPEQSQ